MPRRTYAQNLALAIAFEAARMGDRHYQQPCPHCGAVGNGTLAVDNVQEPPADGTSATLVRFRARCTRCDHLRDRQTLLINVAIP